tara:strand:- start:1620 stop:1865 length:246 start_codon:yes stop_codon:yes gene_type:complete
MKKLKIFGSLLAFVLAITFAIASESNEVASTQGYRYELSEPCQYLRNCNNIPGAPICKTVTNETVYKRDFVDCTIALTHLP